MHLAQKVLGGAVLLLGMAIPPGRGGITVTPPTHDFGKEIVGKSGSNPEQFFVIQLPAGATAQDRVTIQVHDPTQQDFVVDEGPSWRPAQGALSLPSFGCDGGSLSAAGASGMTLISAGSVPNGPGSCYLRIWFRPSSRGPKTGLISVFDPRSGTSANIKLTGNGIDGCVYTVIQGCNYAPLYYGSFNWKHTISGPGSSYVEDVNVDVLWGAATCNVTAKSTSPGRTRVGTVVGGKGLIGVEFLKDELDPVKKTSELVYRIIVACPSPEFPATAEDAGTPSRPADLGDFSQETYKQRISAVGVDLVGTTSQPSPETDALNGVGGRLELHWSLKRK